MDNCMCENGKNAGSGRLVIYWMLEKKKF